MKSFIKITLALVIAIALNGCDKVAPPYKNDVVVTPPTGTARKVLVEDFTGHKCGNCPRATKSAYDLKQIYGDNLIIIAVHAGFYSTVSVPGAPSYTYDFRNTVSTELYDDFGFITAGNPNGFVNRRQVNGSYIISPLGWGAEVTNVLSSTDPVPVKLTIDNNYNSTTRELQTTITTEFLQSLSDSYKLSVYMVEDSIINWQKDYDTTPEDIEFYTHREALRGSMNGTYGDAITGPTTAGEIKTNNYSTILDTGWNENQFSIVAFLYNEATKEILQVEQEHVEP